MVLRYQREKAYHDKAFSEGTRSAVGGFYSIARRSKEYYERFLEARSDGKHVLEYGCGQGSHSMFIAQRGGLVTGIDISEVAIEQSKQSARNEQLDEETNFRVMNAESLEFDDDTFDLVCGTAILHHLDLEKAFSEVARTLRPGGSAIFFEPLGHNPFINLFRKMTPDLRTEDEHPLLMRDLKMAKMYFDSVETHYFHLSSLAAVPFRRLPIFPQMLKVLEVADATLFKLFPFARKYAWTAVLVFSKPRGLVGGRPRNVTVSQHSSDA